MATSLARKLDSFASKRQAPGLGCGFCNTPKHIRKTVDDGRARGLSLELLADFVTSQGHKVSPTMLRTHYRRGHGQN